MMKTSKVPKVKVVKEVFICIRDNEISCVGATPEQAYNDYVEMNGSELQPDADCLKWYRATPIDVEYKVSIVEKV